MPNKEKESFGWMVSAKNFIGLLGIEFSMLHKAGTRNMVRFYLAGVAVLAILGLSFFALYYGFDLMFHSRLAEILLSGFFSCLFGFMYVFLIHTFSKEVLGRAEKNPVIVASNITRILFVVFLGFIISQPLTVFVFRPKLERKIEKYRQVLFSDYSKKATGLYSLDIGKLGKRQLQYQQSGDTRMAEETNDEILRLRAQLSAELYTAEKRISQSSFFIKRIQIALRKYPVSWLISILVMGLFVLPVYLIYTISRYHDYYVAKRENDRKLIEEDFGIFKKRYREIFLLRFDMHGVEFHEPFNDPPFNTERKTIPYKKQDDFLNRILGGDK